MRLDVNGLKISAQFLKGEEEILCGVDFCVRSGEPLAVVGESGSGKTMCALALLGLLPKNCFAKGSAVLDGVQLIGMKEKRKNQMRGSELIYIPQSGAEFLDPALKIKTQMCESLKRIGVKRKSERLAIAVENLSRVGLFESGEVLEKYPHQISGGQAQRVVLAMSLSEHAKLVIADEPTKGIDKETAKVFEEGIEKFFLNACVIVITHDINFARRFKNVAVFKDGKIVECGKTDEVFSNPKTEYTKRLVYAVKEGEDA